MDRMTIRENLGFQEVLKIEKAVRVDTGVTAMTDTEETETQVVVRKRDTELAMRISIIESETQAIMRTEVVITRIGTQEARAAVDGAGTETEILAGHQEPITDSHSRSGQH